MILSQLTTLLSLLTGAWLPTGSGRPGPRGLPAQPQAAANETQSLGQGAPAFPVPSSALGSWKAFLGLQKTGQLGTGRLQHGQDVAITVSATGPAGSGPGDVQSCALHSSRGRRGLGVSVDRAQAVVPGRFGVNPASFS